MNPHMLLELFFECAQQQHIVCHELVQLLLFFPDKQVVLTKHGVFRKDLRSLSDLRVDPGELIDGGGHTETSDVGIKQLVVERVGRDIRLEASVFPSGMSVVLFHGIGIDEVTTMSGVGMQVKEGFTIRGGGRGGVTGGREEVMPRV